MKKRVLQDSNASADAKLNKKTSIAKQVILLGLSFILISAAIAFFTIFGLQKTYNLIIDSPLGLVFNNTSSDYKSNRPNTVTDEGDIPGTKDANLTGGSNTPSSDSPVNDNVESDNNIDSDDFPSDFADYYNLADFPPLQWGDRWATITIPDGKVNNVPIYIGDTDDILKYGVGKLFSSAFPGEPGNIVLSAHVNRAFYCLQDLSNGAKIYLKTVWGDYVYEVTDSFIFNYTDGSLLTESDGSEKLICYTCYPRGIAFRSKRYAIVCTKIAGGTWR